MGDDVEENTARVRAIRKLLGDDVEIRLEVNGMWKLEEAISSLKRLIKFNIKAVEEPLSKNRIEEWKIIKKAQCSLITKFLDNK